MNYKILDDMKTTNIKKVNYSITSVLCTLFSVLFISCDQQEIESFDSLKDTPITVIAGVEGMLTRAGYEGTSVLPETFYLSITQDTEDATSKYNYTNLLMTRGADNAYTAPASSNLLWKDSNRDVAVNAYTTDATTFTVQNDQSTTDGVLASDLLGAVKAAENSDISISEDNISINFRHLLCKLDVTFSWGTEFSTTTKSIKSVVYNGFGIDAVLDRTTATITPGTNAAAITAFVGKTTVDGVEKDMSEAIFAPQVGATPKIVITTSINNVERVFSLNVTAPTDGFVSGKRYTMGIKIGGTGAEISLVSVNDWTEKPVTDVETEQEAFVYNPATNTYEVHLSRGMQAAIDAAELTGTAENPATVTLLADMEVEGTPNEYGDIEQDILVDGGVIVLDLNGHTLKTANTSDNCLVGLRNGATLIVDDSSEEKSGKMITYDKTSDVIFADNGKLVINDGTFEGNYVVRGMDNNSTIEINGGTFIGTNSAMYAQSSILTITGGTFTGGSSALYLNSRGKPTITGGSFSGGKYDINTAGLTCFLSYNEETGEGPTFPGGLSIAGTSNNLNALLATGAAYYGANGNQLTLGNDATTCEGDVTVKIVNE